MFYQSKVKESLSEKSVIERKKPCQIGQSVFSRYNDAKNGSYNRQKLFLLALLREAITLFRKWLEDCINKEVSFGVFFR